ncbi:Fe-S cluster assembly protein HesB [Nonomuraea sp. NPDC046570]|uniref:Fe-S cluster assembly protein HesB n=1 Tax=Nonomuraea sp. NPDC046570 TaxID=3155255 RepID=UPI003400B8FE
MLTLTANAAQAIRDLTAGSSEPEDSGVRISSQGNGEGSLVLTIDRPHPTDEVVEAEGARVYLDPVAASVLEDKKLDAGADDKGGVAFRVADQST